jgi:hypothetical protein
MAGALLLALAGAPSLARAATVNVPLAAAAVAEVAGGSPVPVRAAPGDAANYAAREAATPELGKFEGGSSGIYVGGGTVVVILLVVLIVILI